MIQLRNAASTLLATLLLSGSVFSAQTVQTAPTAEQILGKIRQATGTAALAIPATGLQFRGDAEFMGAAGTYELLIDAQGRFRFQVMGPLPMQIGFDGETCWTIDWMLTPFLLQLTDREDAIVTAALRSGSWLMPAQEPVFTAEAVASDVEGEVLLRLHLRGGRHQGLLRVSTENWLPLSFHPDMGRQDDDARLLTFGDWKRKRGALLPHRLVSSSPTGEDETLILKEVVDAPNYLRDPFAFVAAPPTNSSFVEGRTPQLTAKLTLTGHLLVQASLDDGEARWFIFDTGAGALCVSKPVAAELGMRALGSVAAHGVGGAERARVLQGGALQVGPLAVREPVFVELDLSFLTPFFGEKIAGIVGFGVLARSVVELDMEEGTVAIHAPKGYELHGAAWQELLLDSRNAAIRASFEGDHEGIFKLDTGAAGSTVMFHAPAVRELGLLEGRATTDSQAGGVGGMVQAKSGTIAWFEVAGRRFENPEVGFALENKGAFANPYVMGNLGGGFLAPFRLVFDYGSRRIAFVPRVAAD